MCGAILTRGAKDKNGKNLGEAITNPSVVVEVLSKSTEQRDRNERFVLFSSSSHSKNTYSSRKTNDVSKFDGVPGEAGTSRSSSPERRSSFMTAPSTSTPFIVERVEHVAAPRPSCSDAHQHRDTGA